MKEAVYEKQNKVENKLNTVIGFIGNVTGIITTVVGVCIGNDVVTGIGIGIAAVSIGIAYAPEIINCIKKISEPPDMPPDRIKGVF